MKNVFLFIVLGLFTIGCESPLGPYDDDGGYIVNNHYFRIVCENESWYYDDGLLNQWTTEEECEEVFATYPDHLQQDCYCTDGWYD